MDSPLDILIPVVFIAIFVIRAIKGVVTRSSESIEEEEEDQVDSQDWRSAWGAPSQQQPQQEAPPPVPQRNQWQQQQRPASVSSPPEVPRVEVSRIRVPSAAQETVPPTPQGHRSWPDIMEAPAQNLGGVEELSAAQVGKGMSDSLAPAFAVTSDSQPYGTKRSHSNKLKLQIRGREDLRRAVIFREILDRPRAFDL